ncbi:hypothetical protein T12_4653, partial [Trichinella patagoniensis]
LLSKQIIWNLKKMHSTQLYYCIIIAVNMMVGTADVFTVYLFEFNTSCLLKQVYSDGSSRQGFLENVYNITIDECIYQCFCKNSGTLCNLIQYIKDIKKCTLYNDNGRKLLKNSNNEQSNVPMLFVFKCEPGYQSSLTDTFSRNDFTLHTLYSAKSEIWGLTCLLEQRDLELSYHAHFLGISYGSLESCVFTCSAYASVTSCNAVSEYNNSCSYYNFKVREPPLQNSTAYTSGITIIHLCFTNDLHISSYDVQYGRNLYYLLMAAPQPFPLHHDSINRNIKEASVHLFRYFELCTVRSFPIRSLDNLFILRKFYDIRSFHMCLNLCREVITSWPYRAVVYSKKSQKCAVLGSGIGYETGKLCENVILTEVRDCKLDRLEERADNPPPLKYYFEETNDICFVELNMLNYSNYFTVVQQTQSVESFKQCLKLCRKAVPKLRCVAVDYTTNRQCSLLKRIVNNGTFYKQEKSLFAEVFKILLRFSSFGTLIAASETTNKITICFNIEILILLMRVLQLLLGQKQYHLNLKMHLAHLYWSIIIAVNMMVGTADVFTVYISEQEISCLLQNVYANVLSSDGFLGDFYNSTVEECIYFCFVEKYDEGCNVVKFMKPITTCALYNGSTMELFTEPDANTLPVFHILNCDEGYENSLSKAFPRNSSAINPLFFIKSEEFDEMCLLEMRYVESNFESTFLGNSIGSLEACVFTCHAFAVSSSCNAVIHGDELCSHYYFEVKKPPPRSPPVKSISLIILHLCLENDLHVSSYDVQYGDDLYYLLTPFPFPIKRNNSINGTKLFVKAIESAVRLFKYYELCILRTFPINNLDSIFPLKRFYGVLSFTSCLHLCRQTISTWPYRAVAYIKSDKMCTIFGSGVGHNGKALEKNLQITELRQCTLDRAEERLNNPPPLKYFFEETSDICFVELNTLNYSNYFTVIQQTQNVESFMQCLRNCRKALLQCTAIDYTTRRQCSFLKRISHNGTFRKHENSVFAELLYCETATITDLINDF